MLAHATAPTREPSDAVAAPGGSWLVRVHLVGQQVTGESHLGVVPGTAVAIAVPEVGDAFVAIGGAAGGIVRVARQCCGASTSWTAANVTALSDPGIVAPVDFAVVAPPSARTVPFGEPCAAAPGGRTIAIGVPQLGNGTFLVRIADGLPSAPALCALGGSERSFPGVPLPLQVGPCALLVSADVVTAHATDMLGTGTRPLPVPAVPALGGPIVYAQWGQGFAPLRTSSALALHLFP